MFCADSHGTYVVQYAKHGDFITLLVFRVARMAEHMACYSRGCVK